MSLSLVGFLSLLLLKQWEVERSPACITHLAHLRGFTDHVNRVFPRIVRLAIFAILFCGIHRLRHGLLCEILNLLR